MIDNAEHLIDQVASLVPDLRRNSPALTVLVTSQRPLVLSGEEIWQVGPLAVDAAAELFCLRSGLAKDERVVTSEIRDKDAIVGSIKDFLGKGK